MKIIKREANEKKKPSKSEAIGKVISGAAGIYAKHAENKAATKNAREAFVKENPQTKKQPLPGFSTSQKSFR